MSSVPVNTASWRETSRRAHLRQQPRVHRVVAVRNVLRIDKRCAYPVSAVFTALVIGGLVIWASTGDLSKVIGPEGAFAGLWKGAVGTPQNIVGTLITSTPYIFGSLAVALAFKCGLFNIGVEGQLAVGATACAFVGYAVKGIPFPSAPDTCLRRGPVGGMVWGAIPGALKAYRGRMKSSSR